MIRFNYPNQDGNSFLPDSLLALGDLNRLKFKGSITVSPDERVPLFGTSPLHSTKLWDGKHKLPTWGSGILY